MSEYLRRTHLLVNLSSIHQLMTAELIINRAIYGSIRDGESNRRITYDMRTNVVSDDYQSVDDQIYDYQDTGYVIAIGDNVIARKGRKDWDFPYAERRVEQFISGLMAPGVKPDEVVKGLGVLGIRWDDFKVVHNYLGGWLFTSKDGKEYSYSEVLNSIAEFETEG